ncbi:peptide deformylase [Candidatus Roizmanbacteria bacterium RIFCSPHIGHO2_12_FULL_44_10]|uniref:Peptide deformylase n=1 Tax=Candidatus Roizmanbacteria bacterium RIFCSPHIGHO2_12_FULL_44_10 TaxID=1802054 RepID=A0A1F7I6Y8_9BACT|nr:MAG: peptide deformylase [Candidatus Roizmanbacteria bacterium RIFCSPHIGHO2_12_FULL_44_10]
MDIITVPDVVLNTPTKPVAVIDKKIKRIVRDMIHTLELQKDPEGVGLAANQVGLPYSLFIMKPTKKAVAIVCINPQIMEIEVGAEPVEKPKQDPEEKEKEKLEGCLSIPNIWGRVNRTKRVKLRYSDLDGKTHEDWFRSFHAIIIQHEMDHLSGVVFTQRVLEQGNKMYKEVDGELKRFEI